MNEKIEKLKLELEILNSEYSIIKDKLLLFAAGSGGSFATIIKSSYSFSIGIILYLVTGISFIGLLVNLHKAGKIAKEIDEIKKRIKNG